MNLCILVFYISLEWCSRDGHPLICASFKHPLSC